MFSIVIPTLQKNQKVLTMLIDELVKDSFVGEVIVIDNSLQGFNYDSDKVRVLVPEENLFVNPSWNLGLRESKYDYVGILNDDILIPENLCSEIFSFLQDEQNGLVGIDWDSIVICQDKKLARYPEPCTNCIYSNQEDELYIGYWGIAIFGRKQNFNEIPENIKIWCGDNFLLKKSADSGKKNYKIHCGELYHIGSLSSKSPVYDEIKKRDVELYAKIDKKFKVHDKGIKMPKYKPWEYIFSVKNTINKRYKVITILGLQITKRRKGV